MPHARPSFTAFLIPKIIPALADNKRYRQLVTREQVKISKRFANECAKNDLGIKIIHNFVRNRLTIWLADNIAIKGLPVHMAMRKKFIRQKLESVVKYISQVVVIGAGFDTLCLEYQSKFPRIEFFEIDQFSTQKIKLDALKKMPQYDKVKNLHFIECDLSKSDLSKVLHANSFDSKVKSFFVIEGVLTYLEKKDVKKLFSKIFESAPSGSYIVFGSIAELKLKSNTRAGITDMVLATRKEKYKFAASPQEIRNMVEAAGFKLLETKLYHELQQGIENAARLKLIKKERGEHYYFAEKL